MPNPSTYLLKNTTRILILGGLFSSFRLFIGAISAIYLIQSGGLSISSISYLKGFQSALIVLLSLYIGKLSDQHNRKFILLTAILLCIAWLCLLIMGAHNHSLAVFYFAETCNSLSLLIMLNTYNAYLIDTYQRESRSTDYHWVLGTYTQYSFPGIAISAIVGSFLYSYLGSMALLIPISLLSLLFLLAAYYLPNQARRDHKKEVPKKRNKLLLYRLILKKILDNRALLLGFLLISSYYQIMIQYWQMIASYFPLFLQHTWLLGFLFFCIMLVQSLSGKATKSDFFNLKLILLGLLISNLTLTFSVYHRSIVFFVASILFFYFFLRAFITNANATLHKQIYKPIRSRFDATINTAIRTLAIGLFLLLGLLVNYYDIRVVIDIGLFITGTTLALVLFTINQNNSRKPSK
mgnify:CR=1 FL=1